MGVDLLITLQGPLPRADALLDSLTSAMRRIGVTFSNSLEFGKQGPVDVPTLPARTDPSAEIPRGEWCEMLELIAPQAYPYYDLRALHFRFSIEAYEYPDKPRTITCRNRFIRPIERAAGSSERMPFAFLFVLAHSIATVEIADALGLHAAIDYSESSRPFGPPTQENCRMLPVFETCCHAVLGSEIRAGLTRAQVLQTLRAVTEPMHGQVPYKAPYLGMPDDAIPTIHDPVLTMGEAGVGFFADTPSLLGALSDSPLPVAIVLAYEEPDFVPTYFDESDRLWHYFLLGFSLRPTESGSYDLELTMGSPEEPEEWENARPLLDGILERFRTG